MDRAVGAGECGGSSQEDANAPPSCVPDSCLQQEDPCPQGRAFPVNEADSWSLGFDDLYVTLEGAGQCSQNGMGFQQLNTRLSLISKPKDRALRVTRHSIVRCPHGGYEGVP